VETVLADLELGAKPCLKVFNKRDLVAPDIADNLACRHAAVAVSARDQTTLAALIERMQSMIAFPSNPEAAPPVLGVPRGMRTDAECRSPLEPQPIDVDRGRPNDIA